VKKVKNRTGAYGSKVTTFRGVINPRDGTKTCQYHNVVREFVTFGFKIREF